MPRLKAWFRQAVDVRDTGSDPSALSDLTQVGMVSVPEGETSTTFNIQRGRLGCAEHAHRHLGHGNQLGAVVQQLGIFVQQHLARPQVRAVGAGVRRIEAVTGPEAVALLREEGFLARRLEDGWPEWEAEGLAVARG